MSVLFDFVIIFGMALTVVISVSLIYLLILLESLFEEDMYEKSYMVFVILIAAVVFHGFHHASEFILGEGDASNFLDILSMVTFISAIVIMTKSALSSHISIGVNKKLADELEKRTAELKARTGQLEESNKLKQLIIDILSHDLLNPVGVIKGASELLLEEKQDDTVKLIKQNSERLVETIKTMASLARLEDVKKLEVVTLEIGPMLANVIRFFKPAAEEKKITILYEGTKGYPAKAHQLIEEVFINLISNAIKYSKENGKVIVSVSDAGSHWKVSVKDYGIGISNVDKTKLFQRFQRIKKEGIRGTGLGLAIAKRIVELHGCEIGVEDNPEGGSIFYFTVQKA